MSALLLVCIGIILGQLAYIAWLRRYHLRRLFRRRPKYTGPASTTTSLADIYKSEIGSWVEEYARMPVESFRFGKRGNADDSKASADDGVTTVVLK